MLWEIVLNHFILNHGVGFYIPPTLPQYPPSHFQLDDAEENLRFLCRCFEQGGTREIDRQHGFAPLQRAEVHQGN